jgi:hypothetical protein
MGANANANRNVDVDADSVAAAVERTGLDGLALKPTEHALAPAPPLVTVDYEGRAALPGADALAALSADARLYVTAPVRADGFDPFGDDRLYARIPADAGLVFVAGNGAYLDDSERSRAVAPRLRAALDRYDREPTPWVGTEGVERVAMAAGGVQYDLLSHATGREVRGLRAAGFDGEVAVYAPVVRSDDDDAVLDALGAYVARREPVRAALPGGTPTDAAATGRAREVLLEGVEDYALVGDAATVRERVETLREAGVDTVVGYPARGLTRFG